jgi:hypothetical protein
MWEFSWVVVQKIWDFYFGDFGEVEWLGILSLLCLNFE